MDTLGIFTAVAVLGFGWFVRWVGYREGKRDERRRICELIQRLADEQPRVLVGTKTERSPITMELVKLLNWIWHRQ